MVGVGPPQEGDSMWGYFSKGCWGWVCGGKVVPVMPVVQGRVSSLARSKLKAHLMTRTALTVSVAGYVAFLQQLQWVLCFPSLLTTLPQGRGRRLRMMTMTYSIAETVWKTLPSFHTLNSRVRTASPVPLAKAPAAFPQVTAPLGFKHKKKTSLIYVSGLARLWNR